MKLIVGLGNPGKEYENTRHNIGFMVIDSFSKMLNIEISKEKFNGLYEKTLINNENVILLKPLSYMNLSGNVVEKFSSYFKIASEDILVISDDLDLEIGRCRLRLFGSSGGHNGLKNIEQMIGTNKFKRLRVGIGKSANCDTKDYVLSKFTKDEKNIIDNVFDKTNQILSDYVSIDFEKLMSKYN